MVTAKPDDKKEPARVPRSGHGAASLIPHLPSSTAPVQPEAADAASAQEPSKAQPQGNAARHPPQAE
ncbi:MAG: hypothetical protein ACXWJM_01565 [Ramlibacter sp.]